MAKARVPIPRLLEQLGIKARRDGRVWKALCPNPEHDDHNPSWSIVDDGSPRHGSHRCHSCGFGGGPWELAAAVLDLSLAQDDEGRCEAGEWVWKHVVRGSNRAVEDADVPRLRVLAPRSSSPQAGMMIPPRVVIPSLDGVEWYPRALSYLESRGVQEWQRARWHLGYATRGTLAWRIFVPVFTRGRLLSYVARAFIDDGRVRYRAGERHELGCRPEAALWGEPGFDPEVRVAVVTEGVFKAMAMERAGAPNPCAILGATNMGAEKIEILCQFDALLIAMDPDKAGRLCATQLSDLVSRYTEPVVVDVRVSPDNADEEENRRVWRDALLRAQPALRARRLARLGSS